MPKGLRTLRVSDEGPGFVSCPSNRDNTEIASNHLALSQKVVLLTLLLGTIHKDCITHSGLATVTRVTSEPAGTQRSPGLKTENMESTFFLRNYFPGKFTWYLDSGLTAKKKHRRVQQNFFRVKEHLLKPYQILVDEIC